MGVEIAGVVFGIIEGVALFFGVVWTLVNFYTLVPLAQSLVERRSLPGRWTSQSRPDVPDDALPTVDVLLPAYEESVVIEQSLRSIRETDYPDDRLRVLVLLEPDDTSTGRALDRVADAYEFTRLVVPEEYPGEPNKPRALNYGFEHTDGDVVGVVDAEDIVPEGVFREVAAAVRGGADFVLGHLDMVNEDDGWLNLLFRAEYGYWYDIVVPGFVRLNHPVPLGGTTCFFTQETLEAVSDRRIDRFGTPFSGTDRDWLSAQGFQGHHPWDPENVTEDFELGLFLWQEGFTFDYLDATTAEESPLTLDGWLRQRTRWKKGKLYTFRRYLTSPPAHIRTRLHVLWQSALPHVGPINIAGVVLLVMVATMAGYRPRPVVGAVLSLALAFVALTTGLFAYGYWLASDRPPATRLRRAGLVALTLPFYWLLQWGADLRALRQLYLGRLDWEPTVHLGRNATDGGTVTVQTPEFGDRWTLPTRRTALALAGVLALGFGLRLYGIHAWSLWLDEMYTVAFRARLPVRDLLVVPNDPHPPLYFLLAHVWMGVASSGELAMRALSVVFSTAAIVAVFRFATYLYDDVTGLVAALLTAISTMHVHFGRTIRMYSLFTLLAVASWYGFVRLHERSRAVDAGYLVATTALVYTHVYGLFVVGSQSVYVLLSESAAGVDRRRWVRLQAAVVVTFLPWLTVLGIQIWGLLVGGDTAAVGWIPPASTRLLRDTALMYAGNPSYYPVLAGTSATWGLATATLAAYLGLAFHAVIQVGDGRYRLVDVGRAGMLVSLLLVPVAVPYAVSALVTPIYFPRFTTPATVGLFVLVAKGVRDLPSDRLQVLAVGFLLVGSLGTTAVYYAGDSVEDWQEMTAVVESGADADDALVVQPGWIRGDGGYFQYYYGGPTLATLGLPADDEAITPAQAAAARELATAHGTVWVVQYQPDGSDRVLALLEESHDRVLTRRDGALAVYRFEREPRPVGGHSRQTP